METASKERRKFDRLSTKFSTKVQEIDLYQELNLTDSRTEQCSCRTVNISAGGALIESSKTYPKETLLNLSIDMPEWEKFKNSFFSSTLVLPSPPFGVVAKVIREIKNKGANKNFAVKFVGLDYTRQKAIDNMVKKLKTR